MTVVIACACASAASAAPTVLEIPIPTAAAQPQDITQGPDGNVWFTERGTAKIGRITPGESPTIDEFATPGATASPDGITVGPDGNLWFTGQNAVGKVPPGNPNGGTAFGGLGLISPRGIAAGPDGNLWVVDSGNETVVRITTAGTKVLPDIAVAGYGPRNITLGPDGNMWVTGFAGGKIGRITPAGVLTTFNLPAGTTPWDIVPGSDGNLWYTGQMTTVGRITTAGVPTNFTSIGVDPFGITLGPDGAAWYAEFQAGAVGRVDTTGQTSQPAQLTANAGPRYIAAGPGNTLWLTEETANQIARVSGILGDGGDGAGGGGGGGGGGDTTSPRVSSAKVDPNEFSVGTKPTPKVLLTARTGTKIKFSLSERASVSLGIEQALKGRRSKGRCVKPSRKLRKKKKCTRYVKKGTLKRTAVQGPNRVAFSGRIGKRALKSGLYRVVIVATDAAGNVSTSKKAKFRIVSARTAKRR